MISNKIKQLRNAKGLSQEELANRLCVVRQTVSKWEKGLSVPNSEILIRLAAELDTTTAELLGEDALKPEPPISKKVWIIILLALVSPIWLSIGLTAIAVIVSIYVAIWSVVVSLWSVFASFVGCALGGVIAGFVFAMGSNTLTGIAIFGLGLVCAGFSVYMFYVSLAATNCILISTKKITIWFKNCFTKKEEV